MGCWEAMLRAELLFAFVTSNGGIQDLAALRPRASRVRALPCLSRHYRTFRVNVHLHAYVWILPWGNSDWCVAERT